MLKLLAAVLLASLFWSRAAAAAIPICVEVKAPAADLEGFRKLVRIELDRHPTHRVVDSGCRGHLQVELFDAGGSRFLTAQIDREVPMRFAIKDSIELGSRVDEAIRLVLHNDPAYLAEDVAHLSALQRFSRSVFVRGRLMFRMELFQMISRGPNLVAAPGMALGATRGSGSWQVVGRLYGGGSFASVTGLDRSLQAMAGADVGLSYELLDKTFWSPYVTGGAGVQFLRYVGRERAQDTKLAHVNDIGATVSARVGVRFFRWYNFDLDLFAHGYLPIFITHDVDGALFGDTGIYTPSLQIGLGVGF